MTFQATANKKIVITTKTVTTVEYISGERGLAIPNEVNLWCREIGDHIEDEEMEKGKSPNLQMFLESECSEEKCYFEIQKMINEMGNFI